MEQEILSKGNGAARGSQTKVGIQLFGKIEVKLL